MIPDFLLAAQILQRIGKYIIILLEKESLHRNGARSLVGSVLGARMRFQPH